MNKWTSFTPLIQITKRISKVMEPIDERVGRDGILGNEIDETTVIKQSDKCNE